MMKSEQADNLVNKVDVTYMRPTDWSTPLRVMCATERHTQI
jgi:hypothetical protein